MRTVSYLFLALTIVALASASCPNGCSGHGVCNGGSTHLCDCFTGWGGSVNGGWDCSRRVCPSSNQWWGTPTDGTLANSHPNAVCSNAGLCDEKTGECNCFEGYTGSACQRKSCPNDCSGHGTCATQKQLHAEFLTTYTTLTEWELNKETGCLCDIGYRGVDCSMVECGEGAEAPDPMTGAVSKYDCSGRGICDFATGTCNCFPGFYGQSCESMNALV
eukprot:PLAT4770.1.p1 GENE.PLAT4770.1~~PLAT4770.1.p1  ORF type:complete len:218 (-),score=47.51 PLAT4770.1:220-873(-)